MEPVSGPRRRDIIIQEKEAGEFETGLDAMTAGYLGQNVVEGVGPLVEVARSGRAERLNGCRGSAHRAADSIDIGLGQPKRRLGVAGNLIPPPACGIGAPLIPHCAVSVMVPLHITSKVSMLA